MATLKPGPRPALPCQTHDPDIWFPVGTSGPALAQANLAKSYCYSCPIKQACLQHALETGQIEGVWGGKSEQERRVMQQTYRRTVVGRTELMESLASA